MRPGIKNILLGTLTAGISLAIAVTCLEGYVRLTQTDGSNFDIEMWRYAKDLKRPGAVGHEHIPGKSGVYMGVPVSINSAGWRDRERSVEKPAGVTRIMMLGDSVTFGWGARAEDVTSYRLEKILNDGARERFEVLNTGIGNANTVMEAAYFIDKGHRYAPDIVVLNYFINDAEPTPTRRGNFLTEHFYSAVFIAGRVDVVTRRFFGKSDWRQYYRDLYLDDQPGWIAARRALKELSDYCRQHDVKLVVVHYPELHELSPYPFQDVTNLLAAETRAIDIPFLDLLPSVAGQEPRSLWVTQTDPHPNARAAVLYADAISRFLRMPSPDSPGKR